MYMGCTGCTGMYRGAPGCRRVYRDIRGCTEMCTCVRIEVGLLQDAQRFQRFVQLSHVETHCDVHPMRISTRWSTFVTHAAASSSYLLTVTP